MLHFAFWSLVLLWTMTKPKTDKDYTKNGLEKRP